MGKNSDRSSATGDPRACPTPSSKQPILSIGRMEDLQALREQLQQLKATNEQLREQLREQSLVPDPVPGSSTTPPNVVPVNSLASEATNLRNLYVPRERKCPKFTGKMSVDLLTIEQGIE